MQAGNPAFHHAPDLNSAAALSQPRLGLISSARATTETSAVTSAAPKMHGTINTARPEQGPPAYSPSYEDPLDNGFPTGGGAAGGDGLALGGESESHFGSNVKGFVTSLPGGFRSLKEFFDRRRFSLPGNWEHVVTRARSNISYFKSNYIAICLLLTLYFL